MADERVLDVVLFGATGFVGRFVADYLAHHAPEGVHVGLAGRSADRLSNLRAGLGPRASAWPLIVADATDPASLAALAGATRVVASTAGPFRRYGRLLVEACAVAGTDYADLAAEVLFVRDSIDRYGALAAGSGARVVHACGVDSIPSDLGVVLVHWAACADGAGELENATLAVTAFKGGYSGGTIATMRQQFEEMRDSPVLCRLVEDPYALSPERSAEPELGAQPDLQRVRRDDDVGMWVGPFIMAPFNTRIVRRSNALQRWAYGHRFRYREVMGFGSGPGAPVKAAAATAGLGLLAAGLQLAPARTLLDRLLPAPGEGPREQRRRAGLLRMELHTRTSNGTRYLCRIAARGDPGYAATSVMLGESALCLALDRDRLPARAGVLTPATGMGIPLVDRLRSAGFTFETQRLDGGSPVAAPTGRNDRSSSLMRLLPAAPPEKH